MKDIRLCGDVRSIEYDYDRKHGKLFMIDTCCDMLGCIETFQSIDLDVRLIETFTNNEFDTSYAVEGATWVSMDKVGRKIITNITRGIGDH